MSDQKKSQLTIIFFTVFIYLVGFGVIIPLTPLLGREFGATSTQVGLLMSIYSFMQFLFSPFWGKISDRIGRRPVLLFCLLGEGASYILFASARSLELLFIARAFAGFFGASISTASAYISDITPPNQRSKGMALIGAAFGLGFIVGPALGGALTIWGESISKAPHYGTSFALLWVAVICFSNFLFGLKYLKESLQKTADFKPRDLNRIKQIIHYFEQPLIGSLMAVFFINSMAFSTMEATLVLLLGDRFGWGIKEVSFGFAYIGVLSTINQGYVVRKLLPKLGEKKMMTIGLSALAVSLVGIAVSYHLWMMAIVMTIMSVGYSFTNPSTLGSISLIAPANEQGAVMGTTQGLAALGRILGPAFGGFVYGAVSQVTPFLSAAVMALIAFSIVMMNYNKLPESAKHQH
jgi:MFS transporter, DHA1 family, tetracycline resistance protein